MGVYMNNWSNFNEMVADFSEYDDAYFPMDGIEIILASYGTENYAGDAFVLFRKDGKLYEVNGSHCSCYGLEGQWKPEETTVESLQHRLDAGNLGADAYTENVFADDLRAALKTLGASHD